MKRTKHIILQLRPVEKDKIQQVAKSRGVSPSELIRDYIKQLPKPKPEDENISVE